MDKDLEIGETELSWRELTSEEIKWQPMPSRVRCVDCKSERGMHKSTCKDTSRYEVPTLEPPAKIQKPTERVFTSRGFEDFCNFRDTYGSRIIVRQSSSAEQDCVWIFAQDNSHMKDPSPHLTVEQAKIVADALLAFVARFSEEAADE